MSSALAAGAVVFIAFSYLIAHPYLYIADNFPAAKRSPHEVAAFSGPLKVFLTAPEENWVWGAATAGIRDREIVNVATGDQYLDRASVDLQVSTTTFGPSTCIVKTSTPWSASSRISR